MCVTKDNNRDAGDRSDVLGNFSEEGVNILWGAPRREEEPATYDEACEAPPVEQWGEVVREREVEEVSEEREREEEEKAVDIGRVDKAN